jgi:tetratricopeptide (TPR) repeat protein
MLVNLRAQERRSQEVLERIAKLAEQHPQDAGLHLLLAQVYLDVDDLDKAEGTAKQAIQLDPQGSDGYSLLAKIHMARGSVEEAKGALQEAISKDPRNVQNYVAMERLFEKEGNWDQALKFCEKAHEIDPDSPLVANNLAYLYLDHGGDINVAMSLARAARQRMPDSPNTADTLGWAYYKSGSPEAAIVQLKEGVQKAPKNAMYQYHLGMAYLAARHLEAAQESLQRAIKVDPNFPEAGSVQAALGTISRARLH